MPPKRYKRKISTFQRSVNKMNKTNKQISGNINQLTDILYTSAYDVNRIDEITNLNKLFNSTLNSNVDKLNQATNGDVTSFISKLMSENDSRARNSINNLEEMFNTRDGQLEAFIRDKYRNRLLKQADLHEVASQLPELRSAITITRDAIISADVVTGHMSRTLTLLNISREQEEIYKPQIEKIEEKFKLQEKVKEFIIPRSLEYGEYFVYCIPYSKIFSNFAKEKDMEMVNGKYRAYGEASEVDGKSLYDIITENKNDKTSDNITNMVFESANEQFKMQKLKEIPKKSEIKSELDAYYKNIIINNNDIPLCFHEEGVDAYRELFNLNGDKYIFEKEDIQTSASKFVNIINEVDPGLMGIEKGEKKVGNANFSNIQDCYVKLIDPIRLLPIEIMNEVIGYYYVQEDDVSPLSGILTSTVYYTNFDTNQNENSILDNIATNIVKSFDKKWLEKNSKFKKLIVESLNYYRLNNKRVKFQFIPKEYIVPFKINEDENGKGVSILEPSLFYAKQYLMLLLFKMMTIVLNSNDMKVNYIKSSGIDLNIANKIQDIIRIKQQRQLNLADMFSYTTLVNKIGQGNEMYIPVGSSGERGIETEILAGQDVQLNTELMEMLKQGYISGTGVPSLLINQGNEAEFSKTVELANNMFQGSIISKQLTYNYQITKLYQNVIRFATDIPEDIVSNLRFNFVEPRSSNAVITGDLINNHISVQDFIVNNLYGSKADNNDENYEDEILIFKQEFAKLKLPMLDFTKIDEIRKNAALKAVGLKLQKEQDDNKTSDDDSGEE